MDPKVAWKMARQALDKDVKRLKLKNVELSSILMHEVNRFGSPVPFFTGTIRAAAANGTTLYSSFFMTPGGSGIEADLGEAAMSELMRGLRPGPGTPFDL